MKILNAYCGIGGNRRLWGDTHEITAVELDPQIAKIYQDFFPNDKVIVADAHQYLLEHYMEFDFIWSSPPCPTHSKFALFTAKSNSEIPETYLRKPQYIDLKLYQEIILLQYFCKSKWCVENVIGYYKPLILPQTIQRHFFWSNFLIRDIKIPNDKIYRGTRGFWEKNLGISLKGKKVDKRNDTILRNCVNPELGLWVFQEAFKQQPTLV